MRLALEAQRKVTFAIYADLPETFWVPSTVPFLQTINPPLWELGHLAWFQEYFAWRLPRAIAMSTSAEKIIPPSLRAFAEPLFNSNTVAHAARWGNVYPAKAEIFAYMNDVLEAVSGLLERGEKNTSDDARHAQLVQPLPPLPPLSMVPLGHLALVHEYMHQEAMLMTLNALQCPLPYFVPKRVGIAEAARDISFAEGEIFLGKSDDKNSTSRFQFDNESPPMQVRLRPFSISSQPVTASEFLSFRLSAEYEKNALWSEAGNAWRNTERNTGRSVLRNDSAAVVTADALSLNAAAVSADDQFAAMHVNFFEAEAYCRAADRRLPTEAEWEFAATYSSEFANSIGHVWEWTSSVFAPYPGFTAGVYAEYSAPWFGNHQVLRGASFVTHPAMKYPQYRNFYTPARRDMFCGFRTCALG